jgi:hypothetical protein
MSSNFLSEIIPSIARSFEPEPVFSTKPVTFRLTDFDLAILDMLVKKSGLTRSNVLSQIVSYSLPHLWNELRQNNEPDIEDILLQFHPDIVSKQIK